MDLEQSDPPESNRKGAHYWLNVVKHLRANPGIWYNLGTWSSSVAGAIRRGSYVAFLDGQTNLDREERAAYIRQNYELHSKMVGPKDEKGYRSQAEVRGRYIGNGD